MTASKRSTIIWSNPGRKYHFVHSQKKKRKQKRIFFFIIYPTLPTNFKQLPTKRDDFYMYIYVYIDRIMHHLRLMSLLFFFFTSDDAKKVSWIIYIYRHFLRFFQARFSFHSSKAKVRIIRRQFCGLLLFLFFWDLLTFSPPFWVRVKITALNKKILQCSVIHQWGFLYI